MDEEFYASCGATLTPVLENIELTTKLGIWVELTNLLVPGKNDSDEQIAALARFVAGNIGPLTPLHISAFYPAHKMLDVPAQNAKRVIEACEIACEAGLKYVYPGNITADISTYCHRCGRVLIGRNRFRTDCDGITDGCCELCGEKIPGLF
jgi:pyruvate formate lyase activating enzyme